MLGLKKKHAHTQIISKIFHSTPRLLKGHYLTQGGEQCDPDHDEIEKASCIKSHFMLHLNWLLIKQTYRMPDTLGKLLQMMAIANCSHSTAGVPKLSPRGPLSCMS